MPQHPKQSSQNSQELLSERDEGERYQDELVYQREQEENYFQEISIRKDDRNKKELQKIYCCSGGQLIQRPFQKLARNAA